MTLRAGLDGRVVGDQAHDATVFRDAEGRRVARAVVEEALAVDGQVADVPARRWSRGSPARSSTNSPNRTIETPPTAMRPAGS